MSLVLLNLVLAAGWGAVTGTFSLGNLILGFVLGFGALWLTKPLYGDTSYFIRSYRLVKLVLNFLWELLISSFRVAWDVLTPPVYAKPGVIAVPLDASTDFEILMTANMISLTPGTLSLEVSPDRKYLYVHDMFIDDPETSKQDAKQSIERSVLEALR